MIVHANGIDINYEFSGEPGAPVVVLSHSLGSSHMMWSPQMALLRSAYSVLRYDTRGHGASSAPDGPYTLEQLTEDALALVDALGMEQFHWVGLSMGGMIGQCLALSHQDRLLTLSLCDTAAAIGEESRPVWEERIAAVWKDGPQALVQGTLERWFTPAYLQTGSPHVAEIRDQFLATPVAGFVGCSEAIRRLDYLDRLGEIAVPTLIMVGEDDPGTPVAASRMMHERIPGSRMVVIPSAAHLSNIEQADIFNDHLLSFLKKHS
ncbi:MAG: 3-oxoadipate enol-lactonase [Deltaproteobacteria bacterium]|nr:3-oxoadipate enol-lactonase [Deltaproteobacteria bacterium]MBW1816730.1 3-oxoadipate enol-lactonase [Deltaproteobacteria bacterium]MBW2284409.1 3-oxoadipate enol-lactonase [Deltaproteobacteria bacterium]